MMIHNRHPKRILVIDDSSEVRELVGFALEGYRIHYACDGREGLEMARAIDPDLVVLDVMMPNMDGLAFLDAAKADPRLHYLKILVLSARSLKEHIVEGLRLGALDYVTKPFKADILRAKVDRLIEMRFCDELRHFQEAVWRFINHHVRTPLATINLCAQLVKECPNGTPGVGEWAPVVMAAEQIGDVLYKGTELIDLAMREPNPAPIDLRSLFKEVAAVLEAEAEAAGVDLWIEDAPACQTAVLGDEPYLRRALTSVIRKAIGRSPRGASVHVAVAPDGDDLAVTVSDSGPTLDGAALANLFRPYHLDWCTSDGAALNGGLELSLARLVAGLSGGNLTCAAGPEGGLVFRMALRIARDRPVPRPAMGENGGLSAAMSARRPRTGIAPRATATG